VVKAVAREETASSAQQ